MNLLLQIKMYANNLGVIIDSKFNFKAFINHIEAKIAKSAVILSRLQYLFTLLQLYSSLIHPMSLYGLYLWGSTSQIYSASKTKVYEFYLM